MNKKILQNIILNSIQDAQQRYYHQQDKEEQRAYAQQQEQEQRNYNAKIAQQKAIQEEEKRQKEINAGLEYLRPNKPNPNSQFKPGVTIGNLIPKPQSDLGGLAINGLLQNAPATIPNTEEYLTKAYLGLTPDNGLLQNAPQTRLTVPATIPKTEEELAKEYLGLTPDIRTKVDAINKSREIKPDFKYDFSSQSKYAEKVYTSGLRENTNIPNKQYKEKVQTNVTDTPTGKTTNEIWEVWDDKKNDFVKKSFNTGNVTIIDKDRGEINSKEYQDQLNRNNAGMRDIYAKYNASQKGILVKGQNQNGEEMDMNPKVINGMLDTQKQISRELIKEGLSDNGLTAYDQIINYIEGANVTWDFKKKQFLMSLNDARLKDGITENDYKNLIQSGFLTEFGEDYVGTK